MSNYYKFAKSADLCCCHCRLLGRYIELQVFTWVYNNYHIVDLPWDNPVTWFVAFLGVDHGYYWLHRMAHGNEIANQ